MLFAMRRLLLFFVTLQFALCSCPSGFELVRDGECRGLYTVVTVADKEATNVAISKCAEIPAQPVIIHDQEQYSYWTHYDHYPIGLICNTTSQKWQWADGSSVDFKPPTGQYASDLDNNCKTGCSWFAYATGRWGLYCGDATYSINIYCTSKIENPDPSTTYCENFDDDSDDGVCYQVGEVAENWQDAQLNCKKLGANLASIHNANENAFIRRLAQSGGEVHGVFIGGTVTGKSGNFGWIDGSDWDYENYYPGFPKTGFGDCLVLDTSTSAGQWKNMDCTAKLPVACIRNEKHIVNRNITCSTETYVEEGIIASPGFPFDASVSCEFYLMVDAGKKVELEIISLEANSCCDSLIIYDGYVGGYVLANATGEMRNVTYTTTSSNIMEVQWKPNGGVNVKGVVMTFRGV